MSLRNGIKLMIHTYVILELAIKSIEHDKKLFNSFQFKRSYLPLMDAFLESLTEEFKQTSKSFIKKVSRKKHINELVMRNVYIPSYVEVRFYRLFIKVKT